MKEKSRHQIHGARYRIFCNFSIISLKLFLTTSETEICSSLITTVSGQQQPIKLESWQLTWITQCFHFPSLPSSPTWKQHPRGTLPTVPTVSFLCDQVVPDLSSGHLVWRTIVPYSLRPWVTCLLLQNPCPISSHGHIWPRSSLDCLTGRDLGRKELTSWI